MINKPDTSKRTFTPVSISDSLRNVNKKFLYKFGKLDYIIHAKWGEIVGSFFVRHSEPRKISSIPQSTNEKGETIYEKYLQTLADIFFMLPLKRQAKQGQNKDRAPHHHCFHSKHYNNTPNAWHTPVGASVSQPVRLHLERGDL